MLVSLTDNQEQVIGQVYEGQALPSNNIILLSGDYTTSAKQRSGVAEAPQQYLPSYQP